MQTSRFQLGLIATLAMGLGFSLSSSDAVGYPAGAAVSMGSNPIFSTGGHLAGTESASFESLVSADQAMVITDVVLVASDQYSSCRGSSRITIQDGSQTLASFSVGVTYDSRSYTNWSPQLVGSLQSGIRLEPGVTPTIVAEQLYEGGCHVAMDVEYTLSGYYAQP